MATKRTGPVSGESKKRPRGRPKHATNNVQQLYKISGVSVRLSLKGDFYTYREIAAALTQRSGISVSPASVRRYANGQEPSRSETRKAFGLPVLVPAPACPHCGKVHTTTRCADTLFARRVAEYDAWRKANAGEIEKIVAWAEGMAVNG